MAELILNCRGPDNGPDEKKYYDFEPGNETILVAIERFFAQRSGTPEKQEEYLAELCARSIDENITKPQRKKVFEKLENIRIFFRHAYGGANGSFKRKRRINDAKPGYGLSAGGNHFHRSSV
jgi:hypothetical protein